MKEYPKECPYCGGKAFINIAFNEFEFVDAFHTKKCKVRPNTFLSASHQSIKKQIKAWNMIPKSEECK